MSPDHGISAARASVYNVCLPGCSSPQLELGKCDPVYEARDDFLSFFAIVNRVFYYPILLYSENLVISHRNELDMASYDPTTGLPTVRFEGSEFVTSNHERDQIHEFKFVSDKSFSASVSDNTFDSIEVTSVKDEAFKTLRLGDICTPAGPLVEDRERGDDSGIHQAKGWAMAKPTKGADDKTEFVFRWHFRTTGLCGRTVNLRARELGEPLVSKVVHVTFTFFSYRLLPPMHYAIPIEVTFTVRMHRITRRAWSAPLDFIPLKLADLEKNSDKEA